VSVYINGVTESRDSCQTTVVQANQCLKQFTFTVLVFLWFYGNYFNNGERSVIINSYTVSAVKCVTNVKLCSN